MICANHYTEMPPLKMRCNQIGIHIPSRNPTPAEIIPRVEERLAEHQKHFARTMDPSCSYYSEWKSVNDDLINFLKQLRALEPPKAEPTQVGPAVPSGPPNAQSTPKSQNASSVFIP